MNASLYAGPERRQSPRMPIESITYINFASNNGGILSNISEGGLCFHAAGPVQKTEEFHVWFSLDGYRIETNVELAWTDETQKAGGLRFNSLSPEMHEQLVKWMRKSRISSALSIAHAQLPMLKTQALRALQPNQLRRRSVSGDHPSIQEVGPEQKAALLLFCRGLFTGLLIAALLAAGLLFRTYRRQVGESLVRLGEQFGARPSDQIASPPASPIPRPEYQSAPLAEGVKSQAANHEPKLTGIAASRIFSRVSSPRVPVAVNSIPASDEFSKPPQLEPANGPSSDGQIRLREIASNSPSLGTDVAGAVAREAINRSARFSTDAEPSYSNSSAGKYFEVRNFRDEFRANQAMDELSHVGFHAIIVRSRLLWTNSYHILVGPYSSQGEMEAARESLGSRGFNPRILQSKSKHFSLPPMTLYGTDLTIKDCIVTWELNSPDATVKFMHGKDVVATSKGRWAKRDFAFKGDAIESRENERGLATLVEIQRAGTNQSLLLDGSVLRFYLAR
jgi:hypothetical protein